MKLHSFFVRISLLISAVLLIFCYCTPPASAQSSAQSLSALQTTPAVPARITQAIDEAQLVRLKGNVHPLARPEFDQGPVADSTPMNRMLMVLQRSPEQQAALQKLMDEQLSEDSPNYHKWLTPQQFGAQFGPADADVQAVTDWLTQHGFQRIKVAAGRTVIEFSGNVAQVRNAFHTEIHRFLVNGEMRQANSVDPQIPAALTPVVAGIVSLHNFPKKSMKRDAGAFVGRREGATGPLFTGPPNCGTPGNPACFYVVGPADFAKIYNLPPTTTLDGTGITIGIVADSNINTTDVTDFRTLFGLSSNFNSANIVLNGPDPGLAADEGEADLDVQVSGMVAPGATIKLVVSEGTLTEEGVNLSSLYIIDNNMADVMSVSFGSCEAALGTAANQFQNLLWEQAAAQGITVMVSAGDNGSAGCDNFLTQATAANGVAVSGVASTPFNVAVGGTDFDDAGRQTSFWNPPNLNASGTRESALGYIPEIPWNDSCAATATSSTLNTVCPSTSPLLNIVAGSGGPSSVYAKPSWQSGTITPADGHRDLPDVSLFASDGTFSNSFYLVCEADAVTPPSCASSGSFSFLGVGGTSASSPAFAGIMALINQQQKAITPLLGGRQGNANPVLYTIAKAETFSNCNSTTMPLIGSATCVFYDITKLNNSVPCAVVSGVPQPTCSNQTGANGVLVTASGSTTPAWTTGTGYDLATGLGSVNVTNLAAAWKTTVGAFKGTTTATKINGGTSTVTIPHGQSVTLSATVTSGSGTPTGDVSFLAPNPPVTVNGGLGPATLNGSGTATLTSPSAIAFALPGGSYNLKAHYAGDGNFAPSDDPTGVPVVVSKENSRLQYGIVTFDAVGNVTNNNATSFAYGSPYILRFDILNSSGSACNLVVVPPATPVSAGCALDATGTVTITDNGSALTCSPLVPGCTSPFPVNSEGSGEDQPIQLTAGPHTLSGTYSGDISYNAVTTPVVDTVTVSKATTASALAANPATGVTTATPVALTATISSQSNSATGATGTVTFFDGGTQIGSPATVTPSPASAAAFAGGTASLTQTFSTTGSHSITATYNGDTNYTTSSATAINVTVNSPGSFTVAGTNATITAISGSTITTGSTITVTPSGGFTGSVAITCPTANLPPGVTCPNPPTITVPSGGGNGTGTLMIALAGPSSSTTASIAPAERNLYWAGLAPSFGGGKGWWGLSAVTGLASIFLLLLPGRKRYRAALALGLICVLSFTLGCGSNYSNNGPSPTTTKISVPASPGTKVASGTSIAFTVTVTSTGTSTPTGSVQLYDGSSILGTAGTLANGSATINISTLSVGTHAISAHYLADAYSTASQSGTLNMAITGMTSVSITGTSGSLTANGNVSLTIN